MPSGRITQLMLQQRTLNDINTVLRRLDILQERLATGQRVNSPSDDPVAARRAIDTKVEIQKNEQYLQNISLVSPQLLETETSILTVVDILQRATEVTLQAANGTNQQTQLDGIAEEADALLESALAQANHDTNGRYIFAGTRTLTEPFVATRDANGRIVSIAYEGNDEQYDIPIANGVNIAVNETGQDVFLGTTDVLQTLIDLRDRMLAGDQAALQTSSLEELSGARSQLMQSVARIGAVTNRIEDVRADTDDFVLRLQATLSDLIDADFADTVVNLNAEENALNAALNAAGRILQPSLLDFVR